MANTFTYVSVTNGQAKFKKNSEYWHIIEEEDKLDQIGATTIRMFNHNGIYDINLAVDTVIIDGTTYGPGSAFDTVYDALNPLFHKANTGTGGTGEVPTLEQVTGAGGQTSNSIYASQADFNVLGSEGELMSALTYDSDGGVVTLKDVSTGFAVNLHAPVGLAGNRDFTLPTTGGQLATEAYVDANAGGGGGGLALESYQNSAMTTPVQAYVFRDASNNIVRVYEPLRNNDVSRGEVGYARSIDSFPFDNVNCANNVINDVVLISLAPDIEIEGCKLDTLSINCGGVLTTDPMIGITGSNTFTVPDDKTTTYNAGAKLYVAGSFSNSDDFGNDNFYTVVSSTFDTDHTDIVVSETIEHNELVKGVLYIPTPHTGIVLKNLTHKGYYGENSPHGSEIYIVGNNVHFLLTWVGCATFFDELGDTTVIRKNFFEGYNDMTFSGCSGITISESSFRIFACGDFTGNDAAAQRFDFASEAYFGISGGVHTAVQSGLYGTVMAVHPISNVVIGARATIDSSDAEVDSTTLGDFAEVTPSVNITGKRFTHIGSTTYEIAVTDVEGVLYQTLTAV